MAVVIGKVGGGDLRGEHPLIEADDSWRDVLAAKAFVLDRMRETRVPEAAWFRLWRNGRPITARQPIRR